MHGTGGIPFGTPSKRSIGVRLAGALRAAHYLVATPEMCWSRARIYAKPFSDCLAELDPVIADLRARGAKTIVVGGLSQGGNAALAYGEMHPEIAGVIACAPAHDAARLSANPRITTALAQARSAVAAGQGNNPADYPDTNQGESFTVTATAATYVSFFDPTGPASIAANIGRLTVPFIWIAGDDDRSQSGSDATYREAPANPLSAYRAIHSDHTGTCDEATDAILAWLATLPG
jgi:pimeloyl-ACP methyl ester carboxylesterase